MEYQNLSMLTLSKDQFRIRVRLVRIWNSLNPKLDNELISMDFVVVDEMDTAIQGTIRCQDVGYFQHRLHEGHIYIMTNFIVCPNKPSFRVVPNELMLRFTRATTVTHVEQNIDTISQHKFFFTDFKEVPSRVYKDTQLTDVIGHVLSVSRIGDTYVKEKLTQKKNLEIQDTSESKLLVTLWGKIAETFPENIVLSKSNPVIIIFAGMTVRTFMGRTCLCSSSATRFYIDLQIPEVIDFRQRIDPLELTALMPEKQFTTMSPSDEISYNKKEIYELENLDPKIHQNIRFSCRATIIDIDVSDGWWYNACSDCKVGLKKFENKFWCDRCCHLQDFSTPWYKPNVTVQDRSGHTSFVIFGSLVAELVGITCSTLTSNPNYDRMILPPIFNGLIQQTYNFRVVLGYRDFRKKKQFKVVKIISESASYSQHTPGASFCEGTSSETISITSGKEFLKSHSPPESSSTTADKKLKRKREADSGDEDHEKHETKSRR